MSSITIESIEDKIDLSTVPLSEAELMEELDEANKNGWSVREFVEHLQFLVEDYNSAFFPDDDQDYDDLDLSGW